MRRLDISEKEYRRLDALGYSLIKSYIEDRKKFYKQWILKLNVEDDEDESNNGNLRMGSLVDTLLLQPETLDDKFTLTQAIEPKGQMGVFVNNLYSRTVSATDGEGVIQAKLDTLLTDAYEDTKKDKEGKIVAFKSKTLEQVKEDFLIKKIGYEYYIALRDRGNKIVVTAEDMAKAERMVEILKTHPYTREILSGNGINQLIVQGNYRGLEVKCMIDRVIINEKDKVIQPYDLKTTWGVDMFDFNYIKYKYYIQYALYTTLLREFYNLSYECIVSSR